MQIIGDHIVRPSLLEPYFFDGPYAGCLTDPRTAMDRRHIFLMHEVLMSHPFKEALELGSYLGASSTAFIEAINKGHGMRTTFCDVSPTDSLWDVVGNCAKQNQYRVTNAPSWALLDTREEFDFVLVDANHDLDSVSIEVKKLLARKPMCIMAHDTNATAAGYKLCEGAAMLAETFRALPEYHCIEDCAERPGEQTDRGLFLATTDRELFNKATEVFNRWTR